MMGRTPLAILIHTSPGRSHSQQVDVIKADALFGETALIYDLKRNATVRATDDH